MSAVQCIRRTAKLLLLSTSLGLHVHDDKLLGRAVMLLG